MTLLEEIRAALKQYAWRANIYMSPSLVPALAQEMWAASSAQNTPEQNQHLDLPDTVDGWVDLVNAGHTSINNQPVTVTDAVTRFRVGEADGTGAFSPVEGKAE